MCAAHFEKAQSHSLSDAFFNAYHDELTEIYIFSNILHPRPHLYQKKLQERPKPQNVKIISNGVLRDAK